VSLECYNAALAPIPEVNARKTICIQPAIIPVRTVDEAGLLTFARYSMTLSGEHV
jgi:hypothetical protein